MSDQVSDRHAGDLGGHFSPFEDTNRVNVTVVVPQAASHMPSNQHTAWMLVNLLARLKGVVHRIGLICPKGVPIAGRVVPLAPRALDLRSALIEGAAAVGVIPVVPDSTEGRMIVIGQGGLGVDGDMYVLGQGWWGGISTSPQRVRDDTSALPFGPYVAACLAAGEVFKAARLKPGAYSATPSAFYSAWHHRVSAEPVIGGPSTIDIPLDILLAGVGAVGSTWLHAMWACPGVAGRAVLVDNDDKGVDSTNLNRYPLFGTPSVGHPKATEAKRILLGSLVEWEAHDVPFQGLGQIPPRVISAVDRNTSRAAIQNRYPARILSGSTRDLRAEVLRCGPPSTGACLRCFNPPETETPDEDIRDGLRRASDAQLQKVADAAGVSVVAAREWVTSGKCGTAGEQVLSHIRSSAEQPREFAVGFVSVITGTLLAAETVKDYLPVDVPLSASKNRACFQFWSLLAQSNGASPYGRDPSCPACSTNPIATRIWAERFNALPPARSVCT